MATGALRHAARVAGLVAGCARATVRRASVRLGVLKGLPLPPPLAYPDGARRGGRAALPAALALARARCRGVGVRGSGVRLSEGGGCGGHRGSRSFAVKLRGFFEHVKVPEVGSTRFLGPEGWGSPCFLAK